jgi:hypothetical protein
MAQLLDLRVQGACVRVCARTSVCRCGLTVSAWRRVVLRARSLVAKDRNGAWVAAVLGGREEQPWAPRGGLRRRWVCVHTGFSDPYVEVTLVGTNSTQRVRTSVVARSLNPVWNAAFELCVHTPPRVSTHPRTLTATHAPMRAHPLIHPTVWYTRTRSGGACWSLACMTRTSLGATFWARCALVHMDRHRHRHRRLRGHGERAVGPADPAALSLRQAAGGECGRGTAMGMGRPARTRALRDIRGRAVVPPGRQAWRAPQGPGRSAAADRDAAAVRQRRGQLGARDCHARLLSRRRY